MMWFLFTVQKVLLKKNSGSCIGWLNRLDDPRKDGFLFCSTYNSRVDERHFVVRMRSGNNGQ